MPNFSYFLFKPDSEKRFGEMKDYIEENFSEVRYFAVLDWQDIIRKLYYKHYEEKGDKFSDAFEPFLEVLDQLYGKYGIVAMVKDTEKTKKELVQKVYETKKYLRNMYCKPKAIGLISNAAELPQVSQKRRLKNKIKIIDFEGTEQKQKSMSTLGEYRIHFLNFIHSPDDSIEDTENELRILAESGILKKEFLMTDEDVNFASKYKTFEIVGKYGLPIKENGLER